MGLKSPEGLDTVQFGQMDWPSLWGTRFDEEKNLYIWIQGHSAVACLSGQTANAQAVENDALQLKSVLIFVI